MSEPEVDERDRCLCGAVVAPHWSDGRLERGSCRGCGLQLVRHPGELWRHIRG